MSRSLLDEIRKRPAMYLGVRSLSALQHFLNGYSHAVSAHGIAQPEWTLPQDFHDWVAYRLHFKESTSGYRNMILKHTPSEDTALDKFFELLDEYDKRESIDVARVENYDKQYTSQKLIEGVRQPAETEHFPSTLKLITFTDDPGVFVTSDFSQDRFPGRGFHSSLTWFQKSFGVPRDQITVLNARIWARLAAEDSTS